MIDLRGSPAKIFAGSALIAMFGVLGVGSALLGGVSGGRTTSITVVVVGCLCLLFGLAPFLMFRIIARPRRLIVGQAGIRWDDPRGQSWAMGWDELESVSVSTARQRADPTSPLRNARWRVVVRLDLVPAARWNRADHPELEHLWELPPVKNSYRLPLGPAHAAVPRLDEAMVRFAATKYCGVLDEGTFGLGFS